MKILQVISSFPPAYSYGGALKVAYEISRELVKKNHTVTVFTTDVLDAGHRFRGTSNPENLDGILVYRFSNISNFLAWKNLTCAPSMVRSLKKKIREFDIIHLHEYRSFQAIVVHHFARKYNVPYIIQAHGAVMPVFEKQKIKKLFDILWGNRILKDAAEFVALTEFEAEQYRAMGVPKGKIEVIPNGVDPSQFSNLPDRGGFRSKYHIPKTDRMILFLGRIHRIKGIELLITAYLEILKEVPDAWLVFVGPDDNCMAATEAQINQLGISKKPLFTGALYGKEKLAAYVDADIFVLPSFYEAFPMALLEAMACGLPVVTTVRPDVLDWVDNQVGFVVDHDPSALTRAVIRILNDPSLAEKFGSAGKDMITTQFCWKSSTGTTDLSSKDIITRIEDVYQRTGRPCPLHQRNDEKV